MHGKIGGASSSLAVGNKTHAVILARDLDSKSLPGFLKLLHLQNPGVDDQTPRELIVPSRAVLFANEYRPQAMPTKGQEAPQDQSKKLH